MLTADNGSSLLHSRRVSLLEVFSKASIQPSASVHSVAQLSVFCPQYIVVSLHGQLGRIPFYRMSKQ